MLKAHAVDDRAHVAQTPIGDQYHKVENALAITARHGSAADMLDRSAGQGRLKYPHQGIRCRLPASIPRLQIQYFGSSWSIVGTNQWRGIHKIQPPLAGRMIS